MLGNYKVAAVCVAEYFEEDVLNLFHPLIGQMEKSGWRFIVFNTYLDLQAENLFNVGEAAVFELIDYSYVDALIIYDKTIKNSTVKNALLRDAQANGKPAILINPDVPSDYAINLTFDMSDSFHDLLHHLIEVHKFQSFGLISGYENDPVSAARENIFFEELSAHGISFDDRYFGYGGYFFRPTYDVLDKFLSYEKLPECIVCINDSMAIAVCEKLIEKGYRIPEDVTVTGIDGIVQALYNFPNITTCAIDYNEVAEKIVTLLDDNFGTAISTNELLPYHFLAAESCGCQNHSEMHISKIINIQYTRYRYRNWAERSQSNMLSKLSNSKDFDHHLRIIAHYFKCNGYLVFNEKIKKVGDTNPNTFLSDTFDQRKNYHHFFAENEEIYSGYLRAKQLLPNLAELIANPAPWVIHPLHSENRIFGYMATSIDNSDFFNYHNDQIRIHRLAANINTAMSQYNHNAIMKESNDRLIAIQDKIISGFADIVESRDDMTGQHVKRTSEYILLLLKHLAKKEKYQTFLTDELIDLIYKAAPLHDIGKIKISDIILNKPAKLNDEEFDIIRTHSMEGSKIINATLTGIENEDYLRIASDMALYHHERWDGHGYPHKLSGTRIPFAARAMAVVDVFDALSNKRVYKDAFTLDETYQIMINSSGTQFDPDMIDAFVEIRSDIEKLMRSQY